ncbi:gluconate 2-dehydrogenase subunit 3 family protein [Bradyrhizobium sp. CSA207]|uniref:gluconate 2-dehydrogenase subunit 3 family protein n=1 Tax=Bradyrhizobium sp. CSA207 TaxID=2698826 RepID=UPI0023B10339|nr:gluconate 2-dehydrogenase subunit 3 family protein [Bradyrhizobium sp. CSA207]
MPQIKLGRRELIAGAIGAGSIQALTPAIPSQAQSPPTAAAATNLPAGYVFLKPNEAAFVEALVDHMVPEDELTPSGTDIGLATFIDRALAGSWGKGDRLYNQGPWKLGTPNQGYQLPLTPSELYRTGIAASNAYCRKIYNGSFDDIAAAQKEAFLKDLSVNKIKLDGGIPGNAFFDVVYQTVIEGMFADPIYGGNKNKVCWKMIGFPGVMANNAENIKKYNDGRIFTADPISIADMS